MKRLSIGFKVILALLFVYVLLSFIIIPFLNSPRFTHKHAKRTGTKTLIKDLSHSIEEYYRDTKTYPSQNQGLEALIIKPLNIPADTWKGPYFPEYPLDAWNKELIYLCPGQNGRPYDIISEGPTKSEKDNINSWEIRK